VPEYEFEVIISECFPARDITNTALILLAPLPKGNHLLQMGLIFPSFCQPSCMYGSILDVRQYLLPIFSSLKVVSGSLSYRFYD